MINISKHLTLQELTKSDVAIKFGIDNTPNSDQINNLKLLALKIFEPIREHFNSPIYISSGFRSIKLNNKIGGSKTSQHTLGKAIDIDMDGKSNIKNIEIFNFIKDNLVFDQLIYEFENGDNNPAWVHVSYSAGNNRNEILKSLKEKNKTIYVKYNNT